MADWTPGYQSKFPGRSILADVYSMQEQAGKEAVPEAYNPAEDMIPTSILRKLATLPLAAGWISAGGPEALKNILGAKQLLPQRIWDYIVRHPRNLQVASHPLTPRGLFFPDLARIEAPPNHPGIMAHELTHAAQEFASKPSTYPNMVPKGLRLNKAERNDAFNQYYHKTPEIYNQPNPITNAMRYTRSETLPTYTDPASRSTVNVTDRNAFLDYLEAIYPKTKAE